MARSSPPQVERLVTVAQVAELLSPLNASRRLIAERRIQFVRVGRHVRTPKSAMREFITVGTVEPVSVRRRWRAA